MSDDLQIAQAQVLGEGFEPAREMVITKVESLRVMADSNRLRIVEILADRPLTVKQIARQLGTSPTKLYYHVNLLEEHGFIVVTSSRIVSGIIEKQYRAAANSFNIDRSLLTFSGGDLNEGIDRLLAVVFKAARDDILRGIRSGAIKLGANKTEEDNSVLGRTIVRMTPEQFKSFRDKVVALIKEFDKIGTKDGEEQSYGLTIALYPFVEGFSTEEEDPGIGRWNID
jgi:DNA-binding transcriptional ArsR family regulator